MKKAIKWISIIIGTLLLLLTIGIVALPFVFPIEKIKDIAANKISETINREVKIEKVSFNIFEGIKLEGLSISNHKAFAKKPFVTADAIALRYAFWPLFKRQIIIKEVRLVKPEILIEKNRAGVLNFSDMTGKRGKKAKKRKEGDEEKEKGQGFSMIIDTFSIRHGKITYADYGTKTSSELKNTNLTISGITLALLKPVGFDFSAAATYKGKNVPLSLGGRIALDMENETIKIPALALGIAGEKAAISATISRLRAGPTIDFSISSKKLSIDPLLAVFSAGATVPKKKTKLKRGELTKIVNNAVYGVPRKLSLKGAVDISNLTFLNFKADKADLELSLAYKKILVDIKEIKIYNGTLSGKAAVDLTASGLGYNGNLKLTNLDAAPFSNAVVETFLTKLPDYKDLVNKVYGTLDVSLTLKSRGVEVPDIMANTVASGSFTLKEGELKRLKAIDAIADKLKISKLKQDLKVSELTADFTMKNQIIDIKNLSLKDHDVSASFKGGLDLARLQYIPGNRLTLRGSPRITKDLSREYNLFRNEEGWLEATFELTGSLKKPVPKPFLGKAFEKGVGKLKIKIEAKKVEIEKAAEAEKRKLEEVAKKKAEEEKKRLKEEAKKGLKDLIKF